jgi:glycine cleavage system H protein
MSNVPAELKYTAEHEWVRVEGDVVVIGITHHAQDALGDVVFVDLPEPGRALVAGKAFGVVESVKAVSDLFAPIDGEVTEINTALVATPEGVNADPYGKAWMLKVKPKNPADVAALLDAAAYTALLSSIAK